VVILAGCAGGRPTTRPTAVAPSTAATHLHQPITLDDARQCPVTHPNGAIPPGVGAQAGVNHGNAKLWTALWPGGVIKADPDYVDKDGSIHMKFGVVARGQRTVVDPGASAGWARPAGESSSRAVGADHIRIWNGMRRVSALTAR
jgi:hypothetical protein